MQPNSACRSRSLTSSMVSSLFFVAGQFLSTFSSLIFDGLQKWWMIVSGTYLTLASSSGLDSPLWLSTIPCTNSILTYRISRSSLWLLGHQAYRRFRLITCPDIWHDDCCISRWGILGNQSNCDIKEDSKIKNTFILRVLYQRFFGPWSLSLSIWQQVARSQ